MIQAHHRESKGFNQKIDTRNNCRIYLSPADKSDTGNSSSTSDICKLPSSLLILFPVKISVNETLSRGEGIIRRVCFQICPPIGGSISPPQSLTSNRGTIAITV